MVQHFLCYRELQTPTTVHHTLKAFLTNDDEPDLVVIKPSTLDVYRVESTGAESESTGPVLHHLESFPLFGIVESASVVEVHSSLMESSNGPTKRATNALALTFRTAKLAIVAYDRNTRELRTLSLSNLEEGGIGTGSNLQAEKFGFTQFSGISDVPIAIADPVSRCIAMAVYLHQIVFVPLSKTHVVNDVPEDTDLDLDLELDEELYGGAAINGGAEGVGDKGVKEANNRYLVDGKGPDNLTGRGMKHMDGEDTSIVHRPYLISFRDLGVVGDVVDFAFLDMYREPTLIVLHEDGEGKTSVGRMAKRRDNMMVTVLSIDLSLRRHVRIWEQRYLPFDCYKIVPCPDPTGGALLFSPNSVFYINQLRMIALHTNAFGSEILNGEKIDNLGENFAAQKACNQKLNVLLDGSCSDFLSAKECLISLRTGVLGVLRLEVGAGGESKEWHMWLEIVGTGVATSDLCVLKENRMVFLGSCSSDSLLIQYHRKGISNSCSETSQQQRHDSDEKPGTVEDSTLAPPPAKRIKTELTTVKDQTVKTEPVVSDPMSLDMGEDEDEEDDEDFLLYGEPVDVKQESTDNDGENSSSTKLANVDTTTSSANSTSALGCSVPGKGTSGRSMRKEEPGAHMSLEDEYEYELEVVDNLPNCGQLVSFDSGECFMEEDEEEEEEGNESAAGSKGEKDDKAGGRTRGGGRSAETMKSGAVKIVENKERELVACGGHGKDGNLVIAHHALRPIVGTEAELDGCRAVWTVRDTKTRLGSETIDSTDENENENDVEKHGYDSYLFLSLGSSTMILKTGEEMEPIEDEDDENGAKPPAFFTSGATLACSNLVENNCIVQVFKGGVRLYVGTECVEELTFEEDIEDGGLSMVKDIGGDGVASKTLLITSVDILDPFVLITVNDGSFRLIEGKRAEDVAGREEYFLQASVLSVDDALNVLNAVTAASLFRDELCLFHQEQQQSSVLCVACRASGAVDICSLPELQVLHTFAGFASGNQTLTQQFSTTTLSQQQQQQQSPSALIVDAMMQVIGPEKSRPSFRPLSRVVLQGLNTNGDLLVYTLDINSLQKGSSGLRFNRVHHQLITRLFNPLQTASSAKTFHVQNMIVGLRKGFRYAMFSRFENISGRSGVFFRGVRPCFVLNNRGQIHLVPLSPTTKNISSEVYSNNKIPVLCFTPFHNQNAPHGFIYFHSSGVLRVCQFPSDVSFVSGGNSMSSAMILRKLPLHATPHHIVSLGKVAFGGVLEALQVPTYALICSKEKEWTADDPTEDENENENENEEEKDRELLENLDLDGPLASKLPSIMEESYELRLIQFTSRYYEEVDILKGIFTVEFERYEVVLSVKLMYLTDSALHKNGPSKKYTEWKEKRRPFFVIGTGYVFPEGEDSIGNGRLLLYEIDYAQYATNETGGLSKKLPKLKRVYEKVHRQGAVSQVCQMGPYVLACIGSKIIAHEYKNETLVGCAFYDCQIMIVSMRVVKDYIMYGDVLKSVHFLRWKEKERSLTLLAKDYDPLPIFSTEFSVNDRVLGLVAADAYKNLNVFHYAPHDVDSRGGQQLLVRAEFHVGAQVTDMNRLRVPSVVSKLAKRSMKRYLNTLVTNEGSIAAIVPVPELIFRRLYTLQTILVNAIRINCGLNPREFRLYKKSSINELRDTGGTRKNGNARRGGARRGLIDGKLLWEYVNLDTQIQKDLARCIGTTPEVVIQNILEIDLSTTFL